MSLLPDFDERGLLPPGDYALSFPELRASRLVVGSDSGEAWDVQWRSRLVDNLEILTNELWAIGVTEVFVDGSFVEDKSHPNDIDGYFVCGLMELATGSLEERLNRLNPHKIWTWAAESRRPYRGYPKQQLPMWHRYRVELYPHLHDFSRSSGIVDEYGHELEFPAAFRRSRSDGRPRGIIKMRQGERP